MDIIGGLSTPPSSTAKRSRSSPSSVVDFTPLARSPVAGVSPARRRRVVRRRDNSVSLTGGIRAHAMALGREAAGVGTSCAEIWDPSSVPKRRRTELARTTRLGGGGAPPLLASSCVEALARCLRSTAKGAAGTDEVLDALVSLLQDCARAGVHVDRRESVAHIERSVAPLRKMRPRTCWGARQEAKLDAVLRALDAADVALRQSRVGDSVSIAPFIRNPPWIPRGGSSFAVDARLPLPLPPPVAQPLPPPPPPPPAAAPQPCYTKVLSCWFGHGTLGLTIESIDGNRGGVRLVGLTEDASAAVKAMLRPGDELKLIGMDSTARVVTKETSIPEAVAWITNSPRPVALSFHRFVDPAVEEALRLERLPPPPPPLPLPPSAAPSPPPPSLPTAAQVAAAVHRARRTVRLAQQEHDDLAFWASSRAKKGRRPPPGCRISRWEAATLRREREDEEERE